MALMMSITGCGMKDRVVNLKNRVFNSDSDSAEYNSSETELTGMLLVLDPDKCPLAEGCGPQFSLLGRKLQTQIAITGDISPEHNNLILSVIGDPAPLPSGQSGQSGYENIDATVTVNRYRLRSSIPYHSFLVNEATNFSTSRYGCDLLWDKSFKWSIKDNIPLLSVRMTNTFSDNPQPWIELTFNGNDGSFLSEQKSSQEFDPCGNN